MKIPTKVPTIMGLFLGILAVSTASIFIRFAQEGTSSLIIAAGRMGFATLFLLPFALKIALPELKKVDLKRFGFVLLAGLFLGMHFATWITSLEYTSVASSVVMVTTAPLWVALLSPIFLKEKLTKWVILGLTISMIGSVVVALNSSCIWQDKGLVCSDFETVFRGRAFLGNILALVGAFLSAGYIMIGRRVRNELSLLAYTFLVYGSAAFVLILLVIVSGVKIHSNLPEIWIWILLLALIPQLIGHSTFNYLLKTISAANVSIALLGEPVGTVILAYLFLSEKPSWMEILGGVLILTGIVVATKSRSTQPKLA